MCIYYKLHIISGLVLVGLYQCLLLATDYFVMFIMMVLFNNAYLGSIEQNVVRQFLVVIARIVLFMFIIVLQKWLGKMNGIIKELNDIELLKFIMEEYWTIISVNNTFDGRIIKKNEEYIRTKNDTEEEHGIGIKNIITTVDNCGGSYSIRYDGRDINCGG